MQFSQDQHFTCGRCGRCCRRATVAVTDAEAASYRTAHVGRWFRERADGSKGTTDDPFEPIDGHPGLLQIRKRDDGACGFLSPGGLCRIHEELGVDRKPLACRVFPFRFHPIDGAPADVVVTTSFACPTIVADDGAALRSQAHELNAFSAAWARAQPEPPARVMFTAGRAWPQPLVQTLRLLLVRTLDTPGPDGAFDVTASLRRIAVFLDDLSRPRVQRLSDDDLAQYIDVMSRHSLTSGQALPERHSARLAGLLFRGFLLAAASVQLHLDPATRGRPSAIRATLLRLLAHLHGIGGGAGGIDLRQARGVTLDMTDDAIRERVTHYLRTSFETIGTGRRPIVNEIAMIAAHLNAACVFARMHAARRGLAAVDADAFTHGLLASADLAQADDGGRFSSLLTTLSGGVDALYLFPPLRYP